MFILVKIFIMFTRISNCLTWVLFLGLSASLFGQSTNYIINPSTDGGFEGTHGWNIVNGSQANIWRIGPVEKTAGANGAYVSDNPTTQNILSPQAGSSVIYMYKDVTVPANATSISLSFKYKNSLASSTYPPRCMFVPARFFNGFTFSTDGTTYLASWTAFATTLLNNPTWATYVNPNPLSSDRNIGYTATDLEPGQSYRIIFEWDAVQQTSYTQTSPVCEIPAVGSITCLTPGVTRDSNGNFLINPNTSYQFTSNLTGGQNYNILWSFGLGTITSGQGTNTVTVLSPSSIPPSGNFINIQVSCPTPTRQFNGVNSGPLALDEVSLSYQAPPIIQSLSTASGAIGSTLTLTGDFFGDTSADNVVYLGGVKCPITAATKTSISVTIPTHAGYDYLTVVNKISKLQAVSSRKFMPVNSSLVNIPYSGNASTSFLPVVSYTTSFPFSYSQKFALGDFNDDAKIDIASYSVPGIPQILRNSATSGTISSASFAAVQSITGVTPSYATNASKNMLFADLNNDGLLDLAATNGLAANGGFVNLNSSSGGSLAFQSGTSLLAASGKYTVDASFYPIDVNQDGLMDILGIHGQTVGSGQYTGLYYPATFYLSRNKFDGTTFSVETGLASRATDCESCSGTLLAGPVYSGDVGDLDNDGKQDFVAGMSKYILAHANKTPLGSLKSAGFKLDFAALMPIGNNNAFTTKLADFDGDGKLDVAATNDAANNVSIFLNTSTTGPSFAITPINIPVAGVTNTVGMAVADMNGDGKPDLVVADFVNFLTTKILFLANTSTVGNISFAAAVQIAAVSGKGYQQIELRDIDGDAKPDVVLADYTNARIDVFRNMQGEAGVIGSNQTICYNAIPAAFTSIAPATIASPAYQWELSTDGTTWTNIAGATGLTYTSPARTVSTFFRRRVTNNTTYTVPVLVTVTPVPTQTITAGSRCGVGVVELNATTQAGNTIEWYAAISGGSPLATGFVFTTPSLSANNTYWAIAKTANGCFASSRTSVVATVYTSASTVSGPTSGTRCDAGSVTLSAKLFNNGVDKTTDPNAGTLNWYDSPVNGNLVGSGPTFYSPIISATTSYYVEANNCYGSSARTAVVATVVITPTITSTTPRSACFNSVTQVQLAATASSGTLRWYQTAVSPSPNNSFSLVNYVTSNISRFVSAFSGACESPRTEIPVTVVALPTITSTSPSSICQLGSTTISATSSNGIITWYDVNSGGTVLGTGNAFQTPIVGQMPLASTTAALYYAQATNQEGCNSAARSLVAVSFTGPRVSTTVDNVNGVTNSANITFSASMAGTKTAFNWQRSNDNGATWTDITANLDAGVTYAGFSGTTATSSTLTISAAKLQLHGFKYRLAVINTPTSCINYSNAATLFIADIFGSCASPARIPIKDVDREGGQANYDWTFYDYNGDNPQVYNYGYSDYFYSDNDQTTGFIVDGYGKIRINYDKPYVISAVAAKGFGYFVSSGYPNGYINGPSMDDAAIEYSLDGSNWITLPETLQNTKYANFESNVITFSSPIIARYIRVANLNNYQNGLAEFSAFGASPGALPYIQVAPASPVYINSGASQTLSFIPTPAEGQSFSTYAWNFNGGASLGSAQSFNIANFTTAGNYKVRATQANGCFVEATIGASLVAPFYASSVGANGQLQNLANWSTNANGLSGSQPSDFNTGKIFLLANGSSTYTFASDWTVGGNLRLNAKILTLGTRNLSGGQVLEGSSTAWVETNSTGVLRQPVAANPIQFPIGNSSFSPITLTNFTGSSDTYSARVSTSVLSGGASGTALTNVVNKTWVISKTNTNAGGTGTTLTFSWQPSDVLGNVHLPALYMYNGSAWVQQIGSNVSTSSTSITVSGYLGPLAGTLFMVSNPTPVITSFQPQTGGIGSTITLNGTGFITGSSVSFGGVAAASVVVTNSTQISATLGNGATGSVSLSSLGGTSALAGFTYFSSPQITYFTPTKSNAGTTVTIKGVGFTSTSAVSFGGTPAYTFSVVDDNTISAVLSIGSSGSVAVTTGGGTASQPGFIHGLPYTSVDVLAAWNQVNTSTATYPLAASFIKSGAVASASQDISAMTSQSAASSQWTHANNAASLTTGSAPYLSYQITTLTGTKYTRFVIAGLNVSGTSKLQLRSSVDNYATSLGEFTSGSGVNAGLSSVNLNGIVTQATGTTEFRIYAYNGNGDVISLADGNSFSPTDNTDPAFNGTYQVMVYGATRPSPTIGTLAAITKVKTDPSFVVINPTSNSTGAFSYTISDANVASIFGNRVTLLGSGSATITATQAATEDYAARQVTSTLTVTEAPLIQFTAISKLIGDPTSTLSASSNSAGALTYAVTTGTAGTIAGSTLTVGGSVGTSVITAIQAANGTYTLGTEASILTVDDPTRIYPTLTWIAPIQKFVGEANFTLALPTSNSGGAFAYYSSNTSVATVSGAIVTIVGVGVAQLIAVQVPSGNYRSGIISTTLTVGIGAKSNPTLSNFTHETKTITSGSHTLIAPTTNSSGPIVYISSNPRVAQISGSTVTYISTGTVQIIAIQAGDLTYNAGSIAKTLTIINPALPGFTIAAAATLTKASAITPITTTSIGAPANSFAVSPSLPSGLAFNTSTGEITGTPLATIEETTFTVTATNLGGTFSATINITINEPAPTGLSFGSAIRVSKGQAMTPVSPTVTGIIAQYTLSPTLPAGLNFDPSSGQISGIPTVLFDATTYTITATNSGGATSSTFSLSVADLAPANLNYTGPYVMEKGVTITPIFPTNTGGAILSYVVSPLLPTGLQFNGTTGAITGTPNTITSPVTYTVVGSNGTGYSTTTFSLLVNDAPPVDFSYPVSSQTYVKGTPITTIVPTNVGGTPTAYAISPNLPAGLVFNTATGQISGTPSAVAAATNYVISASNYVGTVSFTINIGVNDIPPVNLAYPLTNRFVLGQAITAITPTVSGGTVVTYTVTPSLPAGLILDPSLGVISGTPTALRANASYLLTATNSGGSDTAAIQLQVVAVIPSQLSYATPIGLIKNTAMTALSPSISGGPVVTYSVSPAFPTGIVLDPSTGIISGTPTVAAARTTYVISATNTGGVATFGAAIAVFDPNDPNIDTDGDGVIDSADGCPSVFGAVSNGGCPIDSDGDGLFDSTTDQDDDNDGILDTLENAACSPSSSTCDTDNDGIINSLDLDSDGDTIFDVIEAGGTDANNDGKADGAINGNGIPASAATGLTPPDTDLDGRQNPFDIDSDGDGVNDLADACLLIAGSPTLAGCPIDSDGDGLFDSLADLDDDNDGILDTVENAACGPSSSTCDTDGDGIPNRLDLDSDGDGIFDVIEAGGTDANNDGKADGTILNNGIPSSASTGLTPPDTDADGLRNPYDVESDGDGVLDATERSDQTNVTDFCSYVLIHQTLARSAAWNAADCDGDGTQNAVDTNPALAIAVNDVFGLVSNGTITGNILANDDFVPGNQISVARLTGNARGTGLGTATFNANTGTMTYTAANNEPATVVTVGYRVCNTVTNTCATAEVSVRVLRETPILSNFPAVTKTILDGTYTLIAPTRSGGTGAISYTSSNPAIASVAGNVLTLRGVGVVTITATQAADADYTSAIITMQLTVLIGDSDGDGVPDNIEIAQGTNPYNAGSFLDSDGDGVPDYVENQQGSNPSDPLSFSDSDGDGVPNYVESQQGTNPAIPGDALDSDGDGVPNYIEILQGTDPLNPSSKKDSDGDGVPDYIETLQGTSPTTPGNTLKDSDGDGIPDYKEGYNATNPAASLDTDGDGIPDYLDTDSNGDGISDAVQYTRDTDADGVPDWQELRDGSNPSNATSFKDSDGDGVPDYVEIGQGTNPLNPSAVKDTDGDGVPDYVEIAQGTSPTSVGALDSDGDGIPNYVEIQQGSNPNTPGDILVDADGDGIPNYVEGFSQLNAASSRDTDADGTPDYLDTDSDNDGILDAVERSTDADGDGVPNYRDLDSDNDGIKDATETLQDLDRDGIPNYLDLDADGDGILDVWEAAGAYSPNRDYNYDGRISIESGAFIDSNGNGLADFLDFTPQNPYDNDRDGTADYLDTDSDNDGILDRIELTYDTDSDGRPNYRDADSDGDWIGDILEGADDVDNDGKGNYIDTDSDGDGIPDAWEGAERCWDCVEGMLDNNDDGWDDRRQFSAVPIRDTDGDGKRDFLDTDSDNDCISDGVDGLRDPDNDGQLSFRDGDSDNDGIPDYVEAVICSNPVDTDGDKIRDFEDLDSDGDGIEDKMEVGLNPLIPLDTDKDGLPNYRDTDSDNDLIPDVIEAGTDPYQPRDTDKDGLFDYIDTDSDGDTILDIIEGLSDTDKDTIPDYLDLDSDGDGIPDAVEKAIDTDGDGIFNFRDLDSDGDGIPDAVEGVVDTDSDGQANYVDLDSDGDKIPDALEAGLKPLTPVDTDSDGKADYIDLDSDADTIPDAIEAGADPQIPRDTDRDGIYDFRDTDSDGDGISDLVEAGPNGNEPRDTDGDKVPDYIDLDSDNDLIPDAVEGVVDTDGDGLPNYRDTDSDDDGISDKIEAGANPSKPVDSDKDGKQDYVDVDSDNDGISDKEEAGLVNGIPRDTDKDGIPDYLDLDTDGDGILDALEDELNVGGLLDCDKDGIPNRLDADQCETFATQGFSPNGDGRNDTFIIPGILSMAPNRLQIFTRSGSLVYTKENYSNDWAGISMDGQTLPDGTYYYVLDFFGKRPTISTYVYLNRLK